MEKVVIVGGGIAGLSCLNALLDQGISALLLEGATVGIPKMCGEFLAPAAVDCLQQWNIGPIISIPQATFFAGKRQLSFPFPKPAGAMARSEVEIQLAARARSLGGRIRENVRIQNSIPATISSPYLFELSTGEVIQAETAFFATGKYGEWQPAPVEPLYVGLKLHFHHANLQSRLSMYSLTDGYLGVVPISADTSNCAALIKREAVLKAGSIEHYFQQTIAAQPSLQAIFAATDFSQMTKIEGPAPLFQLKKLPNWPRAYWIGDAFATLYPAIGSGFAHGITSAILAARCYQENQMERYRQQCLASVRPKVFWGGVMHQAMLRPSLLQRAMPVLRHQQWVIHWCLSRLGYV